MNDKSFELEQLKHAIIREAEIRLFSCTIACTKELFKDPVSSLETKYNNENSLS
ncbi:MAG: hypothetical protein ABSA84_05410 [Gammaproteobacteria bacterium]|jgi:hypothetical protein